MREHLIEERGDSAIRESPCGENIVFRGNRLVNSGQNIR